MSRSPQQLSSTFSASLAAWQQKLPDVEAITEQMLEAGMLYCPDTNKGEDTDKLKVTKLGWVAVAKELYVVKRDDGSYLVTGGLEEHLVTQDRVCDCCKEGCLYPCKHVLAVELFETENRQTVPPEISSSNHTCLDLEKLDLLQKSSLG